MGKTVNKANKQSEKRKEKEAMQQTKKADRMAKRTIRKEMNRHKTYDTPEELEFKNMLEALQLQIRHVDGDGNCMFRSIADQLTGSEQNHYEFRSKVVDYIEVEEEHFKLFMEDDESFDDYVCRMRQMSEWGGHQELYAASQSLSINIVVHQVGAPRFIIANEKYSKRDIHISYHGECHYNSVRLASDMSMVPAEEIDLVAQESNRDGTSQIGQRSGISSILDRRKSDAEATVSNALPWMSLENVRLALRMMEGSVDDAIELLINNPDGVTAYENSYVTEIPEKEVNSGVSTSVELDDGASPQEKVDVGQNNSAVDSQDDCLPLPTPPPDTSTSATASKQGGKRKEGTSCTKSAMKTTKTKTMSKKEARKAAKRKNEPQRSEDTHCRSGNHSGNEPSLGAGGVVEIFL
jgi:OTU domain-containing protein 3